MFVARLESTARPIAVLLGGSGIAPSNVSRKDVGALLIKRDVDHAAAGWMAAAGGDSLRKIGRHE